MKKRILALTCLFLTISAIIKANDIDCEATRNTQEQLASRPIVFIDNQVLSYPCYNLPSTNSAYISNECKNLLNRIAEIEKSYEEPIKLYNQLLSDASQIYATSDPKYQNIYQKLNNLTTSKNAECEPLYQAINSISQKIHLIIEIITKQANFAAILVRQEGDNILDSSYDITKTVIDQLNKEYLERQAKKDTTASVVCK